MALGEARREARDEAHESAAGPSRSRSHLACVLFTFTFIAIRKRKSPTGQSRLWEHFCFRPLWEDEMFARQGGTLLKVL